MFIVYQEEAHRIQIDVCMCVYIVIYIEKDKRTITDYLTISHRNISQSLKSIVVWDHIFQKLKKKCNSLKHFLNMGNSFKISS